MLSAIRPSDKQFTHDYYVPPVLYAYINHYRRFNYAIDQLGAGVNWDWIDLKNQTPLDRFKRALEVAKKEKRALIFYVGEHIAWVKPEWEIKDVPAESWEYIRPPTNYDPYRVKMSDRYYNDIIRAYLLYPNKFQTAVEQAGPAGTVWEWWAAPSNSYIRTVFEDAWKDSVSIKRPNLFFFTNTVLWVKPDWSRADLENMMDNWKTANKAVDH